MTGRALLAIGCNAYDHLNPLGGAEGDGRGIFDALIRPEVGDYDADKSMLLLSPTLQQVRGALTAILFNGDVPDTLTIFFAGHGAVSGGSFYMAMRDSRADALSATALSLADLFRMIAEATPAQTYLIIDACQAGGLIADLNVILKSDVMGQLGTPGITLLATAASNEQAMEDAGQGIGTTALLECIRGDRFLQDSTPALDLVEIGRSVSARVSAAGGQTPVVWGLNLYGPPSFCKNPHAGAGNAPLRSVLTDWPDVQTTTAIRQSLPQLWEPYISIATRWEPREFVDRLTPIFASLGHSPGILINFAQRIADACAAQASGSRDRFREIEVRAACIVALLPHSDSAEVATLIAATSTEIGILVEGGICDVIAALENYEFALVNKGMSELYNLPIRLTKLLGWTGFAVHARIIAGSDPTPAKDEFARLFALVIKTYSLSLVAMSDSQAPHIVLAATACAKVGLIEQGERLLGHLFASCVEHRGQISAEDLKPEKVLVYLMARRSHQFDQRVEVIAQPTELVTALLRTSRLFDLADEFDLALERLDHLSISAFLPDNYLEFAAEHIEGGTNAVFQIGHDLWTVAEIESAWPNFPAPTNNGAALASMMASLLFPDRSPWFLVPLPGLVEAERPPSACTI